MKLTTSQALIRFLDAQYIRLDGKEYKFVKGIAGIFGHGCVLGIGEALAETRNELRFYRVQNEQGAGHMALGYAKQNNRLRIMACTSSIGPGALNMITAAATATANRIPVLFVPGDIFANRQPDPVLQQIEQEHDHSLSSNDAFRPLSKYWDRIQRPEQLMTACINAFRVLTDPALTGAVTLSLPQDVAAEAFDFPWQFFEKRIHEIQRRPLAPGMASRIADLVRSRKKPALLVGGGVRYSLAEEEIVQLAEQCDIPIMETQSGKGQIPWDHPLNLGSVGTTGTLAANRIAVDVDCLLAVGTRLNDFHTASKWLFRNRDLKVVGINVNSMDACKLDALPVLADAKLALKDMLPKLNGYRSQHASLNGIKTEWNTEVDRLYSLETETVEHDEFQPGDSDSNTNARGSLTQTGVLGTLNRLLPPDAVVVCAGGSLPSDLERLWRCRRRGGYHLEYAYSCMGYEIPGGLGAKIAEPDREVWIFLGDGTYLMYHQELLTAIAEGIKLNIVLFENGGWQCIDNLQTSQGIRRFGCERRFRNSESGELDGRYVPVDFAANAESYGALGIKATTEGELAEAISAARESEKTCVIAAYCVVKSMSGSYGSWWNAGTPEHSENERVVEAYREMEKQRAIARLY